MNRVSEDRQTFAREYRSARSARQIKNGFKNFSRSASSSVTKMTRMAATAEEGTAPNSVQVNAEANAWRSNSANEKCGVTAGNSGQGEPATSVFCGELVERSPDFVPIDSTARSNSLQIRVGWRDIWFGEQSRPDGCPVWRALRRNGYAYFIVRGHDLRSFHPGTPRVPLPDEVQRFTTLFDIFMGPRFLRPLFFWPFTFQIELPA